MGGKRKLTDDFGRDQRSFLHGGIARGYQLHQRGQEEEREGADYVHDAHR